MENDPVASGVAQSGSGRELGERAEVGEEVAGEEGFLRAPEDIGDFEVFAGVLVESGDGETSGVVALLDGDGGGDDAGGTAKLGVGVVTLAGAGGEEVRGAGGELVLAGKLMNGGEVAVIVGGEPLAGHEVGILHGDRFREGLLQGRHIGENAFAVGGGGETRGYGGARDTNADGGFREVDAFDAAVEFGTEGGEELVEAGAGGGVPTAGDPAGGAAVIVVLTGGGEIGGRVDDGIVKGGVLELDEEFFAFGLEEGEVLADGVELKAAGLGLEFAPGVFDLKAGDGGMGEEGRDGESGTIAVDEDEVLLGGEEGKKKEDRKFPEK